MISRLKKKRRPNLFGRGIRFGGNFRQRGLSGGGAGRGPRVLVRQFFLFPLDSSAMPASIIAPNGQWANGQGYDIVQIRGSRLFHFFSGGNKKKSHQSPPGHKFPWPPKERNGKQGKKKKIKKRERY